MSSKEQKEVEDSVRINQPIVVSLQLGEAQYITVALQRVDPMGLMTGRFVSELRQKMMQSVTIPPAKKGT